MIQFFLIEEDNGSFYITDAAESIITNNVIPPFALIGSLLKIEEVPEYLKDLLKKESFEGLDSRHIQITSAEFKELYERQLLKLDAELLKERNGNKE
jgi:hypothetical protein